MDKKEEFKTFVKSNPKLINYVKDGSSSWQKFYEIYDLYGDDKEAWKSYLGVASTTASLTGVGLTDLVNWFKGIDLDGIQNGISSLQRVIGVVEDLSGSKKESIPKKEEYKPRPVYKHFED